MTIGADGGLYPPRGQLALAAFQTLNEQAPGREKVMFQRLLNAIRPSKGSSLAKAFWRLGWAGFWVQIVFCSLSIFLLVFYFTFSTREISRGGASFAVYLSVANFLLLLVTICWSYRYTRLGRRLRDPENRPSESQVTGIVWTGVVASTVGMFVSMLVIIIEAGNLLFFFLQAPQGGIPVVQASGNTPYWVSTMDMVSLMAAILTLFAELLVLVFSLWLLFQTTLGSPEIPQPAAQESQPVS
jgi:hypothetical protein